jgi:hypothetical protein
VNLLTTFGPASVGLIYKDTVGTMMSESDLLRPLAAQAYTRVVMHSKLQFSLISVTKQS